MTLAFTSACRTLLVLLLAMLPGLPALAASPATYNFSFSFVSGSDSGSGLLTGTSLGGGEFLITGATGTIDGNALSLLPQTLAATQMAGYPPVFESGLYIYDDVLYTSGSGPYLLDSAGIAVSTIAGSFNLISDWSPPSSTPPTGYYVLSNASGSTVISTQVMQFQAAATAPEPASLGMLGVGLLLLAARFRRARPAPLLLSAPVPRTGGRSARVDGSGSPARSRCRFLPDGSEPRDDRRIRPRS